MQLRATSLSSIRNRQILGQASPQITGIARPGNTLISTHDLPWLINGVPALDAWGEPLSGTEIVLPYYVWDGTDIGLNPGDKLSQEGSNELTVVDYNGDTEVIINAVIAAEGSNAFGQDSEANRAANKWRFDDFITGCKNDPSPKVGVSNFDALKSWRIALPNTLDGFLVCGVGPNPTLQNFVEGDYSQLYGLAGNGTSKYLDTNRSASADPTDNRSLGVWRSTSETRDNTFYAMADKASGPSASHLSTTIGNRAFRAATASGTATLSEATAIDGFWAVSRENSTQVIGRYNETSTTFTQTSAAPADTNYTVFGRTNAMGVVSVFSNAVISFYFSGESVDLEALEVRLTTLFSNFA